MRPIRFSLSAVGVSAPIPLDIHIKPFSVSVNAALSGGTTATYNFQHTYDNVFSPTFDPATADWNNSPTVTDDDTQVAYTLPVTAVRLNVSTITGTTVNVTIVQAGLPG